MTPSHRKDPLYRKVNTRARGVRHRGGGDFRHERNTKRERESIEAEVQRGTMHGHTRRGLDYTPLFRFLLSRIGEDWVSLRSEAVRRLDREEPIYWMVARTMAERRPYVLIGANAYYSGLYVDEEGRLAKVDPSLANEDLRPVCPCCTHTFNGVPLVRKYVDGSG